MAAVSDARSDTRSDGIRWNPSDRGPHHKRGQHGRVRWMFLICLQCLSSLSQKVAIRQDVFSTKIRHRMPSDTRPYPMDPSDTYRIPIGSLSDKFVSPDAAMRTYAHICALICACLCAYMRMGGLRKYAHICAFHCANMRIGCAWSCASYAHYMRIGKMRIFVHICANMRIYLRIVAPFF